MKTLFSQSSVRQLWTCALFVLAAVPFTKAGSIEGAITFDGRVTLNTTNVSTATMVTSWVAPTVGSAEGDFETFVNPGAAVTFSAPWNFTTVSPITNFWQVGGFHFDLLSSSIVFQGYGFVSVEGTGVMYGNNFAPTAGTWSFTTQNPSSKSRFSFSAAADALAVPESGSTLALFGGALMFVALCYRLSRTTTVG